MEKKHVRRLGILGGSFNPMHIGHRELAERLKESLGLDHVLLVVAKDPPHKALQGNATAMQRYEMAALAVKGHTGLMVSDAELKRSGKSYTVDTLREMTARYPGAEIFLLLGGDMLRDLHNWRQTETIASLATLVGVCRKEQSGGEEEAAERLKREYCANVRMVDVEIPAVSSTEIRRRVARAEPLNGLICKAVHGYIIRNALYVSPPFYRLQMQVKDRLSEKRYTHTMGVMAAAMALAWRFHENGGKARLAALLHDCGRAVDKSALGHGLAGARMAAEEFHIQDRDVLDAIARHTTLGKGASTLAKIIWLADMIEPGREFPGVETLRALAERDLYAALREGLRLAIEYVVERKEPLHPDSLAALEEMQSENGCIC